jgi:hypothetical protein
MYMSQSPRVLDWSFRLHTLFFYLGPLDLYLHSYHTIDNAHCTVLPNFHIETFTVAYMDLLHYVRHMGFSWADGDHDLTMMMVVPDSAGDAS